MPIGCIPESAVHWTARNRLVFGRSSEDGHIAACKACAYIVGHKEEELRKRHLTPTQRVGLSDERAGRTARPFDKSLAELHLKDCGSCRVLVSN